VIVKLGDTIVDFGGAKDYTIDYGKRLVKFKVAPPTDTTVSIFSIGFNGSNIIDLDSFVGDGTTTEFVTKAPWLNSLTSLVYVDGVPTNPALFKTDRSYVSANRLGLRFGIAPAAGVVISYVVVSGNQQTFAITQTEKLSTNGGATYTLQYPIGNSEPLESNILVRVDQSILLGPSNSYFTIENNKLQYTIDPTTFLPYSVPIGDIRVLANGMLLSIGQNYTIDLSGITISIDQSVYDAYVGKKLVVSIVTNQTYSYDKTTNQITFAQPYDSNNIVEVISSYRHDILDIERTDINVTSSLALTPDTVTYYYYKSVSGGVLQLTRSVLSDSYVWVIKNGTLLTPAIDYKLNDDKTTITLAKTVRNSDQITLITFSSAVLTSGIAYMQFKDMLNRVHFKRLNLNKETYLVNPLRYNDISITVADASKFDAPNPAQNKPGIIEIRGERIEFFKLDGNVLSQLRRGTLGTGTPVVHNAGAWVQEIGASETIPYTETTVTNQVISDGTNIVSTTFTPTKSDSFAYPSGYTSSIPAGYGQSDDIEVFIGGYDISTVWAPATEFTEGTIVVVASYTYKCLTTHTSSAVFNDDSANWQFFIGNIRLKKKPYKVHNVNQFPDSPEGDLQLDAEFAVDGISNEVRLTTPLADGTFVTVIKRQGTAWDSTLNILEDNNDIARFLKAQPGIWYKEFKQISTSMPAITSFDGTGTSFDSDNITFDQG
jgi:hypothetical protein